ncbi:MAG: regulatory protein RecX [Casimicrobiaceae bacterium]
MNRLPRTLKSRAIACLARREYGRADLRARLLGGYRRDDGPTPAEVDALLDELVASGLLSDARYAQALVNRKQGTHSRRAITGTLKGQGVDAETIAAALAEVPVDDTEAMRALWQRRFGTPAHGNREKSRQIRFLQSRGFALAAIFRLLREVGARGDESAGHEDDDTQT